jgi:hypothetical protein
MTSGSHIAAFITGHSVRGCTGLSADQFDFLRRSELPDEQWLPCNFPYHETFPFRSPNLIRASLNNSCHYYFSRFSGFRDRHRDQVIGIFSGYEKVILLAGSCGLELLNNLELPDDIRSRLHVFSYGAVSRELPDTASHLMVRGSQDFISRIFHRHADHCYASSHMGYLRSPETMRLFNSFCRRTLQEF